MARVALIVWLGTDREETRGYDFFALVGHIIEGKEVACYLLADEFIVGQILVEGADHRVTVPPRKGIGHIDVLAARLRIARDIQPVAAPVFTEALGGEQIVHY